MFILHIGFFVLFVLLIINTKHVVYQYKILSLGSTVVCMALAAQSAPYSGQMSTPIYFNVMFIKTCILLLSEHLYVNLLPETTKQLSR